MDINEALYTVGNMAQAALFPTEFQVALKDWVREQFFEDMWNRGWGESPRFVREANAVVAELGWTCRLPRRLAKPMLLRAFKLLRQENRRKDGS